MKNIFRKISAFMLAVSVCFGMAAIVHTSASKYTVVEAADYYAKITATSGNSLLGQVHDLITTTHKNYTSYSDCKNPSLIKQTDKGSTSNTVMDFYTQEDIPSNWNPNAGGWNREHVWCQSLSNGMWGTSNGGSDMHHIRPSEVRLNGARGNNTFGEVNGGNPAYYKDSSGANKYVGGYISGGTFEPLDKVKGDVARIVMYVYTHYNTYSNVHGTTNGSGGQFGTLQFTKIMSLKNETNAINLLLSWHMQDPVDQIETARNNAVYNIQGNRNPFIDHPEYANAIWGSGTTPVDPVVALKGISLDKTSLILTKGGKGKLSATPNPSNAKLNVSWASSNTAVATVAQDGTVTAVGKGTATITAVSKENSAIKATATVTVNENAPIDPNKPKIEIFKNAVVNIEGSQSLSERFETINGAIASLNALSEEEKLQVSTEIETLQMAIDEYNKEASSYNSESENAEAVGLHGLGGLYKWLGAFLAGLNG